MLRLRLAVFFTALLLATPSIAARCGGDFNTLVASMSAEAASAGILQGVISQAFGGVSEDKAVLNFDRRQRHAALPSGMA
jgi:membrane-bound lytic murein transglycosylase B